MSRLWFTLSDIADLTGEPRWVIRNYWQRGQFGPKTTSGRGREAVFDAVRAAEMIAVCKLVGVGFKPEAASKMVFGET